MDNVYSEISTTLDFLDSKQIKELYETLKTITNHYNSNIDELKTIGLGESSLVFELKDKVIKISFIEYDNHPSLKEYVSRSSAIVQPEFEYLLNLGKYKAKVLVVPKLNLDNITFDDVLKVYVNLRNDGYLWYDTKLENLGKDKNGICYLLDYGELIYLNDLDDYKKKKELESHRIKKSQFDEYYNSLLEDRVKNK